MRTIIVLCLALVTACGGENPVEGLDGSDKVDAAVDSTDASVDAGEADAGTPDAGQTPDAGEAADAGEVDAGELDAGQDAGTTDAGELDAGEPVDAGHMPDPRCNTACTTGLSGVCGAGVLVCTDGQNPVCTQQVQTSAETCDSLDNNCDGLVDNDVPVSDQTDPVDYVLVIAAPQNIGAQYMALRQWLASLSNMTDRVAVVMPDANGRANVAFSFGPPSDSSAYLAQYRMRGTNSGSAFEAFYIRPESPDVFITTLPWRPSTERVVVVLTQNEFSWAYGSYNSARDDAGRALQGAYLYAWTPASTATPSWQSTVASLGGLWTDLSTQNYASVLSQHVHHWTCQNGQYASP